MTFSPSSRRDLLAGFLALSATAAVAQARTMAAGEAWTRPTAQGLNAAAYLMITNTGPRADRLISASSPVAAAVSLHESHSDNGVVTMRAVDGLPIHGGATLILAPGGYHLMLEGLRRPLALGERFPLELDFFKAGAVRVEVLVRGVAPDPAMAGMKMTPPR